MTHENFVNGFFKIAVGILRERGVNHCGTHTTQCACRARGKKCAARKCCVHQASRAMHISRELFAPTRALQFCESRITRKIFRYFFSAIIASARSTISSTLHKRPIPSYPHASNPSSGPINTAFRDFSNATLCCVAA